MNIELRLFKVVPNVRNKKMLCAGDFLVQTSYLEIPNRLCYYCKKRNGVVRMRHVLENLSGNGICFVNDTMRRLKDKRYLENYGYKVYSQNDEDGIIHEIFLRIGTKSKTFIEIGVQDGLECNTHYLLFQGWRGLWIEANENDYWKIQYKFYPPIREHRLRVINEFVTTENVNNIIVNSGINGEVDLLSIDIDGNDWHVLKEIDSINPRVIVTEYNGKFPPEIDWVMPYDEKWEWDKSDCHGASLWAFEKMLSDKGYRLVGTSILGTNAFFVRQDCLENKFDYELTSRNLYNPLRLGDGIRERGLHFTSRWKARVYLSNHSERFVKEKIVVRKFDLDKESESRVYIWGCGAIGKWIFNELSQNKKTTIELCDSNKMNEDLFGKKIKGFEEMRIESIKYNIPVIIACADSFWEMVNRAQKNGINNIYYVLSDRMRDRMFLLYTKYRKAIFTDVFFELM